jgi:hypothetical protein
MLTPVPTLIWRNRAVNRLEGPFSAIRTDAVFLPKEKGPGGLPGPTGDLHLAYQDVSGAPLQISRGREQRTCGCGLVIIGIDGARLPLDLPLRCRCGSVRGVASDVSPSSGFPFVRYCKDCQAFARFLERSDVVDPAGGTDIFQMPAGRVKLTAGTDAVRCLRLSHKGVLRWYTDCCRTRSATPPPARLSRSSPWVILSWSTGPTVVPGTRCSARRSAASTNAPLSGPLPPNAPAPPSLGVFARRASKIFGWWVLGLGRPSPLFDDRTNAPRAVPRVLTQSERAGL